VAAEKEKVRLELVVTAEMLANIAAEKEGARLMQVATAEELAEAVINKEKIKLELVVTAKELVEKWNKIMADKELKIVELKKENEGLKEENTDLKKGQGI